MIHAEVDGGGAAGIRNAGVKEQYQRPETPTNNQTPQVRDNTRKCIPETEDSERELCPGCSIKIRSRIRIQAKAQQSHHQKMSSAPPCFKDEASGTLEMYSITENNSEAFLGT